MVWSITAPQCDEATKIRWELVPYMHGRALDLGCGLYKIFPHFIGVDNGHHWGPTGIDVRVETAEKLELFADASCDCVFSSHLLEHLPLETVPAALKEWARVLKPGGYLILYLPDSDQYPKHGTHGANPDHKWDVDFETVVTAMDRVPRGWDLIDYQKRDGGDEYSLFFVFKITGEKHVFGWTKTKPEKTCAVVRYGAIGDMIMASSLFPRLKEQGYHVTLYCQAGQGYEAVKHDPNVDRFIVQGKDEVPPRFLNEFWDYARKKYTKWINLCESVEGTLLACPGRASFEWPNEVRAKYMNVNYLEFAHQVAQVPPPYEPKFYATPKEREQARYRAGKMGRRNILWSLAGSSGHKVWPHLDAVMERILATYPDTHIVLVGDEFSRLLQTGWDGDTDGKGNFTERQVHPRVHCMAGKWTIRESLAFAEVADLIIGTETGLLNAAGMLSVPKIVTLSHSSQEMLTKHWANTIVLEQPAGVGCNKHPCRQLHGGSNTSAWADCPKHEDTGTALCQFHIGPDQMWGAVMAVLGMPMRLKAA